jgi:hypothetical protein
VDEEMEDWEIETGLRERRFRVEDRANRKASIKMLCANLYRFWKRDPAQSFGISKRKNFYSEERGRLGPFITKVGVNASAEFLEDRGFLEVTTRGSSSTVVNSKSGNTVGTPQEPTSTHLGWLLGVTRS